MLISQLKKKVLRFQVYSAKFNKNVLATADYGSCHVQSHPKAWVTALAELSLTMKALVISFLMQGDFPGHCPLEHTNNDRDNSYW